MQPCMWMNNYRKDKNMLCCDFISLTIFLQPIVQKRRCRKFLSFIRSLYSACSIFVIFQVLTVLATLWVLWDVTRCSLGDGSDVSKELSTFFFFFKVEE
jgi:hypothetical protein